MDGLAEHFAARARHYDYLSAHHDERSEMGTLGERFEQQQASLGFAVVSLVLFEIALALEGATDEDLAA